VLVLLALAARSFAQELPDINAQNFRPTVDGQRTLWTDDTWIGSTDNPGTARAIVHYTGSPLVYRYTNGEQVRLLGDALEMDLMGGFSFADRVRVGAIVPVFLVATGELGGGAGLGDLGLDAKVVALHRADAPIGLGLAARLSAPTATTLAPVGAPGLGWEVSAVVDREIGPVLLASNLGVRGTPRSDLENITWNDQFMFRVGGGYAITEGAGAALELNGLLNFAAPLGNAASAPLEWMASGYGRVADDFVLRGGVGTGLTRGIGSPDVRLLVSMAFEPGGVKDSDGDLIVDKLDECPLDAEDTDGFADEDGCPELDNDLDGVADAVDRCPVVAEDLDTWKDEDGCPDPTTMVTFRVVDGAGAPISLAKVVITGPDGARQAGGPEQKKELDPGTYTLAAAANGFAPIEGVSVRVVDGKPQIFEQMMTPVQTSVVVSRDKIELKDSIYFETGKAVIKAESNPLLDEVVATLKAYPEIAKLRIEGHTDSRGSASTNQKLSEARAAAVLTYLVEHGVSADRMSSAGFGESKPIDPREVAEAWDKNRRVDFFVEVWKDEASNGG
jgi:outer membrane protein OmpA-like peptidoglycan-associated protein